MAIDKILQLAELRANKNKRNIGEGSTKPIIYLAQGDVRNRIVEESEAAIIQNKVELYQNQGKVAAVVRDKAIAADGSETIAVRISEINKHSALQAFEASATYKRFDIRADDWLVANCPEETASAWLAQGHWNLPVLAGFVTSPTIRGDGSVLETPGYDEATGLVYDPSGCEFPPMLANPTREDALEALSVLMEPIAEFPFTEGALPVALSGLMTPIVRRILGTAPLHAFTAPTPGSGKSLLVDVASVIATGERAAVLLAGAGKNKAEEQEKQLVGCLLAGYAVISLDNLEGTLESNALCSSLTQERLSLRGLGKSSTPPVEIKTAFFATGNNLTISGDLTRRVLIARLDPGVERPELREFAFNPVTVAREKRGELVKAIITIIRAWLLSGEKPEKSPLGSFEKWSSFVRDPLIWLGVGDPVDIMESVRSADPETENFKALAFAWFKEFGNSSVTISDVIARANARDDYGADGGSWLHLELREAVLAVASRGEPAINARSLAWWLRKKVGRVIGNMQFFYKPGENEKAKGSIVGEPITTVISQDAKNFADEIPF